MKKAIKILSIDDHQIITNGLENITQKFNFDVTFNNAKNSNEAFRLLKNEKVDLIILDISLKGKSGLDVLKEVKSLYPKIPVLMFSLHSNIEFVRRSLKLGASGYVTKDSSEEEIADSIKNIIQKGHYISKDVAETLIFTPESLTHGKLSGREFEILVKIGEGKSVREIAAELYLSENTVETYRSRIKEKMNMKRDADLIRYCIASDLVKIEHSDSTE
jgi:two-component system, NarL family, invasion response regulator UvrY